MIAPWDRPTTDQLMCEEKNCTTYTDARCSICEQPMCPEHSEDGICWACEEQLPVLDEEPEEECTCIEEWVDADETRVYAAGCALHDPRNGSETKRIRQEEAEDEAIAAARIGYLLGFDDPDICEACANGDHDQVHTGPCACACARKQAASSVTHGADAVSSAPSFTEVSHAA